MTPTDGFSAQMKRESQARARSWISPALNVAVKSQIVRRQAPGAVTG